jgi:hypothetical protein
MTMRALAAVCVLAGVAACDREEVAHYRVAKELPPRSAAMPAGMGGGTADAVAPAEKPSGAALGWTLPKGWVQEQGGAMRYASFKVPVKGTVDASVVVLPGPAGGELANVNRWRGQIGLAPLDEGGLAASRKTVATKAGPLKVYDFASGGASGKRLIAGLTENEGNTWFVKLTGEAGAVGAARDDFMKLLGSLRFDETR